MDNDIKHVHVGQAIDKRRNELGLSKSELGRKIGVPQQHINRILERETMETNRLIKVSEALDFNFFSLFCPRQHNISAHLAAVALDGNANNLIGDAELAKLYHHRQLGETVGCEPMRGEYLTVSESSDKTFYLIDMENGIVTGTLSKQYASLRLRLFYLF